MKKKAVVLLSGGLDSSTTLGLVTKEGYEPYALSVFYGQRNEVELLAAKKVAQFFSVREHKILQLDLRAFGASSLTCDIEVKKHNDVKHGKIPQTYVPARNTILLSLALAYAEVLEADHIFYGANVHDYSGYPDCRPSYVKAFQDMANLSTKRAAEDGHRMHIEAPLMDMSKAQIIQLGLSLGLDYAITHSCYDPKGSLACGLCSACYYRAHGFKTAQVEDPTIYI